MRLVWIIYLISLAPILLHAQDQPGLLKQSTHSIQVTPGDTSSWEYSNRQTYSYNSQKQLIFINYEVWDKLSQRWDLTYEARRKYDMAGNQTYFWSTNYDADGNPTLEWESFRKYEGDLRIESLVILNNYEEDRREEMLINYTYDEQDRLTVTVTEFWDNRNIHWKRINTSYFNENGCEIAKVEKRTEFFIDRSYDVIDSAYIDYLGNCIVRQVNNYSYVQEKNAFVNYTQFKIDYEFDQRNYITQETHFEKSATDSDWIPLALYQYEKNAHDQILTYHFTNLKTNFEKQETYRYDGSGNIVFHSERELDLSNGEWINIFEFSAQYFLDSLLENYVYLYGWDRQMRDYRYYVVSNWEYDENNYLIRETQDRMDLNRNNQELYFISRQWTYLNRCDGVLHSERVEDIESINAPNNPMPEKTVHEYYDNALCDPVKNREQQLIVFPNPAQGEINVYCRNTIGRSRIILVNDMGQEVYAENRDLNNYFSLNTYDLPSGIYTLQIHNGQTRYSEKISIVR